MKLKQINQFLKLMYDKEKGTMGFTMGPNFTFTAKRRRHLRMGLRAVMEPSFDGPVLLKKGGKMRQIRP